MNNEFLQYALDIVDNLTDEELEAGLREFGLYRREVSVFNDVDVNAFAFAVKQGISSPATSARRFLEPEELASVDCAANDNSYALAA